MMQKNMYEHFFLNIHKAFNCTNQEFDKIRKFWMT